MAKPLVSISCITYNHALYLRQCLDGFIMQKTNFPIEVLIHDDASTDGTADIIKEYELKYPEIIKAIYQTENQFSKGISISRKFNFPRIRGKYLALCEGDDYWIDEYKLQKQVDFLEANEDFSICFHPVKVYSENDGDFVKDFVPEVTEITDLKTLAVLGNYMHTPSVMFRKNKKILDDYNNFPNLRVGDYILNMLFAKYGKIKKLPDTMAVYRLHNDGIWELKPENYKHSIWQKVLVSLINYYIDYQEICALLIEQYRRISNPQYYDSITHSGTIYFDTGNGYSEYKSYRYSFTGNDVDILCHVPDGTIAVRLDPVEGYGCVISNLEILSAVGILKSGPINGYKDNNGDIIFTNIDSQIIIHEPLGHLRIRYQILLLSDFSHYRIFNNYIRICQDQNKLKEEKDDLIVERNNILTEQNVLIAERDSIINQHYNLIEEHNKLTLEYYNIVTDRDKLATERYNLLAERDKLAIECNILLNSRSWRITKPLRKLTIFIRHNNILHFFVKGVISVKRIFSIFHGHRISKNTLDLIDRKCQSVEPNNYDNKIIVPIDKQNNYQDVEGNHKKKLAFTICSLNYFHLALSLRESFLLYNHDWDFTIIIQDMVTNQEILHHLADLASNNINFIFSLAIKNEYPSFPIEEINIRYDVVEANTAIKPFVFDYFFQKGYEKLIYFDPDIMIYDKICEIDNLLDKNNIILTPHMTVPYPEDGKGQHILDISRSGIYNCGFVAMSFSDSTEKVLDFWKSNLRTKCYVKVNEGLFTDQIWANWFPAICEKCFILKNPGYNVAYWNLHERIVKKINNKWYINDEPLIFFHFSGFNINNINIIAKYQNRYTLENREPDLKRLFEDYAKTIRLNDFDVFSKQNYFFNKLPQKSFILKSEHRENLTREYLRSGFNAFAADGSRQFFLNKKIHSRYMHIKFPKHPFQFLSTFLSKEPNLGVNVIGYFDEMHSLGEAARYLVKKIYTVGIPFSIYKINNSEVKTINNDGFVEFNLYSVKKPLYPINIFVVNADQMPRVYNENKKIFKNKINLGIWSWEFETGFGKYADSYKYMDGILVHSNFMKICIEKYLPTGFPNLVYLHPFIMPGDEIIDKKIIRERYNIPQDYFMVFFNFDYNSSYDRKNPEATLRAFNIALKDKAKVCLVIKTTNQLSDPDKANQFNNLVKELDLSSHVFLIDMFLTKTEMLSIINACDVYISLHRAEGFGLGLLEAMSLGKPVIASNYSGNLDFMNKDNSILIESPIVDAHTDFYAYKDVEFWADPDINAAAQALKKLYNEPCYARDIGRIAKQSIMKRFSDNNFYNSFCQIINFAFQILKVKTKI